MKQNPSFMLKEIAGVPYLLPFGQMIADHKRGLKTNATGLYLWNMLKEEHSLNEVLSESAAHYGISSVELPAFQEDITQFITSLISFGILLDSTENNTASLNLPQKIQASRATAMSLSTCSSNASVPTFSFVEHILSIGGLHLKLVTPEHAFPPDFSDFIVTGPEVSSRQIDLTIVLHPELPQQEIVGKILLQHIELNIIEQGEQYLLHFPASSCHLEIHLSKDGHTAHCYSLPPYTDKFHYDFFHAIRLVYLYLAQSSGMVALHSASILYKNRLWLFSGHSGMGKSTHTNLWKEHFDTPIINGDLNLLATEYGKPVVHGIPWCGTSGIYDTKTYPLGGIILLNKAPENKLEKLALDQKQLLISQRLISPSWTKALWEKNLELVETILSGIFVCKLHCTKSKEAVDIIKQGIDSFLV